MTGHWERVAAGIRAHLFITCPACGVVGDYIEWDAAELDGATEVVADCPECDHPMTAYLDALVQHPTATEATA